MLVNKLAFLLHVIADNIHQNSCFEI